MQDFLLFLSHHILLAAAFVVMFIIVVVMEFARLRNANTALSPTATTRYINHEDAKVLDIRSVDAFKNGHIIGAVSIPLEELSTKHQKLKNSNTKPIIVVCATGLESNKAIQILHREGYTQLYTLAGGMRAWREAEMPMVKD